MVKYHTEDDDGKQTLATLKNPKARWETMRNIKAAARIKTLGKQSQNKVKELKEKDASKKELQDMEEKLIQLEKLPTEATLTKHWADNTDLYSDEHKTENSSIVKDYNEKIAQIINNRNITADQAKERVTKALEVYSKRHKEEQEKINKLRNAIIAKKKKIEAIETEGKK